MRSAADVLNVPARGGFASSAGAETGITASSGASFVRGSGVADDGGRGTVDATGVSDVAPPPEPAGAGVSLAAGDEPISDRAGLDVSGCCVAGVASAPAVGAVVSGAAGVGSGAAARGAGSCAAGGAAVAAGSRASSVVGAFVGADWRGAALLVVVGASVAES
jgi:hypothetical protein